MEQLIRFFSFWNDCSGLHDQLYLEYFEKTHKLKKSFTILDVADYKSNICKSSVYFIDRTEFVISILLFLLDEEP